MSEVGSCSAVPIRSPLDDNNCRYDRVVSFLLFQINIHPPFIGSKKVDDSSIMPSPMATSSPTALPVVSITCA
ncbi:MAG: hypothetical protein DYG96_04620 [Chlorobi bacterium CHB2]|nr:hypothetical protein [Chlorobi bacterium CHB2]